MKLLRGFRQHLIKEGKLKKYLWYAIGEILLVMAGILLAFQVNNWNDNRIKKNTEITYYNNIKDQITDDKILLEEQIAFNNGYMSQFIYANNVLEQNDRSKIDTLGIIVRNMTQYSDFDKQGNIYETLVNSGEIKLLKNNKIVNGIRELEEKYIYLNRMENIHYDAMMTHVVQSITPIIKFSNSEVEKPNELYSYEFQNLLLALLQIMTEKDKVYNEALEEVNALTYLINEEITFK